MKKVKKNSEIALFCEDIDTPFDQIELKLM